MIMDFRQAALEEVSRWDVGSHSLVSYLLALGTYFVLCEFPIFHLWNICPMTKLS